MFCNPNLDNVYAGPSGNTGAMSLVSLAATAIVLIFCRVQTAFLQGLHGKPYGQHCHFKAPGVCVGGAMLVHLGSLVKVQQEQSALAQTTSSLCRQRSFDCLQQHMGHGHGKVFS